MNFSLRMTAMERTLDRKSTRLNSSHTVIYTLSLHDALPIYLRELSNFIKRFLILGDEKLAVNELQPKNDGNGTHFRSEEHTSELQSHSDLHSFPTRRSSDLSA